MGSDNRHSLLVGMKLVAKVSVILMFSQTLVFASPPSQWCNLVLTQEQFSAYQEHVKQSLAHRAEPLREGELHLNSKSGKKVDVREGINRELAKPILDLSKNQMLEHVNALAATWFEAVRADVMLRYQVSAQLKQNLSHDAEGFPLTPLVQNNIDLARAAVASSKTKLGAVDIEVQVAKSLIEKLRKKYFAELSHLANEVVEKQIKDLEISLNQVSPDWNAVRSTAEPLVFAMTQELQNAYTLNHTESRMTLARQWVESLAEKWLKAAHDAITKANRKNGTTENTADDLALASKRVGELQKFYEGRIDALGRQLETTENRDVAVELVAREISAFRAKLETEFPIEINDKVPDGVKVVSPFSTSNRKNLAVDWVNEVADKWLKAVTGNIKLRQHERSKVTDFEVALDADGLPLNSIVQGNRELALKIKKGIKKKISADRELTPHEIAARVEAGVIAAQEIETATAKINELKKQFVSQVETIHSKLVDARDWQSAAALAEPLVASFRSSLEVEVPVDVPGDVTVISPFSVFSKAAQLMRAPLPEPKKAEVNQDGVVELQMPELGVRAYYDVELATVVLESSRGLLPNDKGILLALDHGDSTTASNASSWKYIIPNLVRSNFNTFAMNLPGAGIGSELVGLFPNIELLDVRFHKLRERADAESKTWMPLVHTGRSLGATRGFAHSLLREGPENIVGAYFEMSFSNPFKVKEQLELVHKQIEDGAEITLVPDVVKKLFKISGQLRKVLVKLKKKDPHRLQYNGLALLFLQGRGDRDSGPTVVKDLIEFRDEYAPAAMIYEFEFPLEKYNIPGIEKMPEDHFEAQHNLLSNFPNMSVQEALQKFPGIDPIDRPMMADQNFEVIGAMYAFADVLAQNSINLPQMQKRAQMWREYRKQLIGSEDASLLEWYRETNGILQADVAAAKAGRESRAGRLKRIAEFKERAMQHYGKIAAEIAAD